MHVRTGACVHASTRVPAGGASVELTTISSAHTHTHTHTHTRTRTHTHSHTHTRAHTCTRARTRTRAHTDGRPHGWMQGVAVVGYQTDEFPAFFTPHSGCPTAHRADSAEECAQLILAGTLSFCYRHQLLCFVVVFRFLSFLLGPALVVWSCSVLWV